MFEVSMMFLAFSQQHEGDHSLMHMYSSVLFQGKIKSLHAVSNHN